MIGFPANNQSSKKGPAFKPQLLVCYLCGQQFGTASLGIHVPQCYTKKTRQWEAGNPDTRGKKPKHPDTVNWSASGMTKEEQADEQFREFTQNLEPCPNCGRKFLPDRLVVHLRSCAPGKSGGGSKPVAGKTLPRQGNNTSSNSGGGGGGGGGGGVRSSSSSNNNNRPPTRGQNKGPAFKPQLLVCYLCGQQFGTASLGIHVPQCYEKKTRQWEAGNPDTRGKKPKHPDTVNWSASGMTKEEQADEQFREFTQNLEPCPNCGRKFLPDRLVVHLRSCAPGKSGGGSKPVSTRPGTNAGINNNNNNNNNNNSSDPNTLRPSTTIGGKSPSPGRVGGAANHLSRSVPASPSPSNSSFKKLPPKLQAIQRIIFNDLDITSNEKIDINKLRIMVNGATREKFGEDSLQLLMSCLDVHGTGLVDKNEWAKIALAHGESMNPMTNRLTPNTTSNKPRTCPKCKAVEYDMSAKFCKDCGNNIVIKESNTNNNNNKTSRCSSCDECCLPECRFCPNCGDPIDGAKGDERGEEDNNNNNNSDPVRCPGCSAAVEPGGHFCDNCGCKLIQEEIGIIQMLCEDCGEAFDAGAKYCEECGNELKEVRVPNPNVSSNNNNNNSNSSNNSTSAQNTNQGKVTGSPSNSRINNNNNNNNNNNKPSPSSSYDISLPPEAEPQEVERTPCNYCGRNFAVDIIQRHEHTCQKSKPKKVFDSRKARMAGTEAEPFKQLVDKEEKKNTNTNSSGKKPPGKWKQESEAFRSTLKQARMVDKILKSGGTSRDLPPPVYSSNDHYIPCPYCNRRFAQEAADRHIPRCATTVNKPKPPPKMRR